jgi:soluble lytic murein transglycosylase-like protein
MNKRFEKHITFRIGVIFHGNKIWLSELLSYLLTLILLALLLTLSTITLKNELRQSQLATAIKILKSELIHFEYEQNILQSKSNIQNILKRLAFKKVSSATIASLTDVLYVNSHQFGYDPLLLLAVIQVESVFDPNALGRYRSGNLSGAYGLMQLKFATAQETAQMLNMGTLSNDDLLKPDINLILGTAYLTKLISRFHSFKLGLIAYNIGPEKVKTTMRNNDTLPMNYYSKVISAYFNLKRLVELSNTSE